MMPSTEAADPTINNDADDWPAQLQTPTHTITHVGGQPSTSAVYSGK